MTLTSPTSSTHELQVAVATPLHQTFTYRHHENLPAGVRVMVPFGFQTQSVGVVVGNQPSTDSDTSSAADQRKFVVKPIRAVLDAEPVYSEVLLNLADWMSKYYMHPIGEVLRTMLPASKVMKTNISYEISATENPIAPDKNEMIRALFGKRQTITHVTLIKKLRAKGFDKDTSDRQIKLWIKQNAIKILREKSIKARQSLSSPSSREESLVGATSEFRALNQHQQAAVDRILAEGIHLNDSRPRKPFLLFGITGSGKTEVFLNAIHEILSTRHDHLGPDPQALVLVPEISLTPQMTRIFSERFPGVVAVVHSAMEDDERWQELNRVRVGDAKILIGPRSAIFGPFANLKLIIVDEEHDSSYKQGNGLLYNARDIAILRGQMEKATVVLGSATPSMESWYNAKINKYTLLELPERASTKPLPSVEIIHGKPSFKALSLVRGEQVEDGDSPFDASVISALQENARKGEQSIVLVNRRGFAYYLVCVEDRKAAGCPNCSISLSVHGRKKTLRCHYCDYTTTMTRIIEQDPGKTWAVVGYGSQKAEENLRKFLPDARITRIDSDTVQDPKVLPEVLNQFRNGDIDILVGTQILAKGHDFPNVTLIVIVEIDQLLGLPDFRGGERTFQLLVQAAGRSGRGAKAGNVIVQSVRANHPVVYHALRQDFLAYAKDELIFRQTMGYPPFSKIILFEMNGPDSRKLDQWCVELETKLSEYFDKNPQYLADTRILGPAAAPIEVIRGRTRRTIMIVSKNLTHCRNVASLLAQLTLKPPHDIRVKIDVDPQSTL